MMNFVSFAVGKIFDGGIASSGNFLIVAYIIVNIVYIGGTVFSVSTEPKY